jgi:hypothetical protein
VGSYYNDFNIGAFIITSDESGLLAEIPTLDQEGIGYDARLEAVRPDNFVMHYPDGTFDSLSFIRDDEGEVEYIRHRNYVGERVQSSSLTSGSVQHMRVDWTPARGHLSVFE